MHDFTGGSVTQVPVGIVTLVLRVGVTVPKGMDSDRLGPILTPAGRPSGV